MHIYDAKGDEEVNAGEISHYHKEYEIYYMVDGEAEFRIEGFVFHPVSDSLLIIPANSFHQWDYPTGRIHHRITIHFLPELLNKVERDFFLNLFTAPLHFLDITQYKLNFYIQSIVECEKMEEPLQKLAIKIRTLALLSQLSYLHRNNTVKPIVLDARIRKVLVYINDHLIDPLTMVDLSNKFLITKSHLHYLFRKMVGMPIMKYINIKRLGLARQEILDGTMVGEAAYRAGFNEYSTFFRAYKSFYGSAPSELLASGFKNSIIKKTVKKTL